MAARYGADQAVDAIDQAMNQLKEAVDGMPFARFRFTGQHKAVTRAVADLAVAMQDVKPYLKDV
ncbi:hypothetical protein ADK67_44935 [Saccharothrix sp. NRRL B-16348]|uniref:hypothetical protein n=1 Tax=Saccharothrix sp. NRRL B-16348 TaxID=1415542 RepID=UPI0006B05585|nr:hypothetical protein [Saccharothrix sp. NRRL B-16348]KOX12781.1 hypothetical protein ADK67_44935 [Saccharothrix sp. NRRL B-16348]